MYLEDDYLMLSGIQHFCFCRRQWALIHIEQLWAENYHTTLGDLFHKRAHEGSCWEKRGDVISARGMRIASPRLGVSGQCDVIEFHKSIDGISLQNYEGKWSVIPIEYKKGSPKEGREDELQLCTQAICLEEMLLTKIEFGYLFYGETKRRKQIVFSSELRKETEAVWNEMHELFKRGYTPKVKQAKRCQSCSLKELCLPRLQKVEKVSAYIKRNISDESEQKI